VNKWRSIVPHEELKKEKIPHEKPKITNLGSWPTAEKKIIEREIDQGIPPEDIETLLDEIREARKKPRLKSNRRRVETRWGPGQRS
jgi:hypothetical protein